MRYRIGEEVNTDNLGEPVVDMLLTFSVFTGLIIGIIFIMAGKRVKQYWLIFWGTGLVAASIIYLAALYMGLL